MTDFSKHQMARQLRKADVFASAKTFAEIGRRIAALKTTKERGDACEIFAVGYLALHGVMQATNVWVNGDIPISVLKKLNIPRGGACIDSPYEDNDRRHDPYQVNFRQERPNLTLEELGR